MITASDWRPLERNTLKGFATISLDPSGIALHDCTYHRHPDGREWIGLPGKPQIDRNGELRKDPATGKQLYTAVVEIPDRDARDRFQREAVAAVKRLIGGQSGGTGEMQRGNAAVWRAPAPTRSAPANPRPFDDEIPF